MTTFPSTSLDTRNHPDTGTLRAYLDHEAPDHAGLTRHVRQCLPCRAEIRTLRADLMAVGSALDVLVDSPSEQVGADTVVDRPKVVAAPTEPPRTARRWRGLAVAASIALLTGGVVATPTGRSMASSVLSVFRSTQVDSVELTTADAEQTAQVLSRLATAPVEPTGVQPEQVADVAAAQARVPFPIAQADAGDLPAGLAATPSTVMVSPANEMTVEFDEAQTRAYLDSVGSDLAIPAGYDGQKLVVRFPDAVALSYAGGGDRMLYVATAAPLGAEAVGPLSLEELRSFLLDVPGLPSGVVEQLGSESLSAGNLPIPVPTDLVTGQDTTVAGHKAVQLSQPGLGGGVIWQQDERIIGVAGTYDDDALRGIAEGVAR